MRKVLFVTGIRSEYDILYSVISAIDSMPDMQSAVVVTGAHLSPMYGYTYGEIQKDGFRIAGCIESLLNSDSRAGRIKSAAIQLSGLVDLMEREKPTFVVAPMDREEGITVALAGAYLRIPVVHIGGGDTAEDGNVDNAVRHAVTKLSHLHMVTTESSAQRVTRLGEEPWRVSVVGNPGLDRLLSTPEMPDQQLWERIGYGPVTGPFVILIQHAIISDADRAGELMRLTLQSLREVGLPTFVSYPNSDSGSQQIIQAINEYASEAPNTFHTYRNLPRLEFVNLLRRAHVLVGNSSCGITEGPLLKVPVVNIGARQRGREHAENVQFVDHDGNQIKAAVNKAAFDTEFRRSVLQCRNPYGDGHAAERIAGILARQPVDERLLNKITTF